LVGIASDASVAAVGEKCIREFVTNRNQTVAPAKPARPLGRIASDASVAALAVPGAQVVRSEQGFFG
jgi:hypothetical protein